MRNDETLKNKDSKKSPTRGDTAHKRKFAGADTNTNAGNQLDIFQAEGEVVKHSAVVQISNEISLVERKIWNVLFHNAYDRLRSEERHSISIGRLVEETGLNSKNYAYVKARIEALVSTQVKWNLLGKSRQEWGISALLAGAVIHEGGLVTYSFEPHLKEKLHNPRVFARINLAIGRSFSSKYALPLYELVVDYGWEKGPRAGKSETPWLTVEKTRQLMGATDVYPGFYDFKRRVLRPAAKEVTKRSGYECHFKTKKDGRRYSHVKFISYKKGPAVPEGR